MKVISITLKNFRQFYGEQIINFSSDDDKNITLIHGENNGGKTALLNAMLWCLYQKTSKNLQSPGSLLNSYAKSQGSKHYSVTMELEVPALDGSSGLNQIKIERRCDDSSKNMRLDAFKVENFVYKSIDNPQFLINQILPVDMAHHFFYQGEGGGTLNETTSFQDIKKSIHSILGFSVAKKTIEYLNAIRKQYIKELASLDRSGESTKLTNSLHEKESRLRRGRKRGEDLSSEIDELNIKIKKISASLINSDSEVVKEKEKRRVSLQRNIKSNEQNLQGVYHQKKILVSKYGVLAFSSAIQSFDSSAVDTQQLNMKQPFSVTKKLVNEILQQSECICGAPLHSSSEALQRIEGLLKEAVDPDLKYRWNQCEKLINRSKREADIAKSQFIQAVKDESRIIQKLKQDKSELEELQAEIQTKENLDVLEELEQKRAQLELRCRQQTEALARSQHECRTYETDIRHLKSKLDQIQGSNNKVERCKKYQLATEKLIHFIKTKLDDAEKNIDITILQHMNDFLAEVSWQGYRAKGKRGDITHIELVDKHGQPANTGNGFQTMLAVSFVIALIHLAKKRKDASGNVLTSGTVAPFVADAPFGYLSTQNSKSMAKHIADSVEQAIYMLSTTHWTSDVDEGIKHKIGREYNLVQYTTLSKDQFKEKHTTSFDINEQTYDVVRFEAEYDYVKIEEIDRGV